MADFPMTDAPAFSGTMAQITNQDRGAPDTFNPRYQLLLDNDNYLKREVDRQKEITQITLSAYDWSAESPYTQTIQLADVTEQDCPIVSKCVELESNAEQTYDEVYGIITRGYAQCQDGRITFYVYDKPIRDISINLLFGRKGDGYALMTGGGSSDEKSEVSNVVMTITDNAAVAEGGGVTAMCNNKSWTSTIKKGKAKLYASEVGNYTITVTALDGTVYTTMLVCPYFGQFSTDIYSGTLMVTCTEEGGNGKSCNVRSCDDEYNPTDTYNLTQTFDTGLELTFLGIPAGKYLVTVDDKYVFFKEIQSIQNINSVNVELKQWLYRNGDQCLWNTGGWMKCLTQYLTAYNPNYHDGTGTNTTQSASAVAEIRATSLYIKSSAVAPVHNFKLYYYRGGAYATANIGTIKPLATSLHHYNIIKYSSTGNGRKLTACFRTGSPNNTNTTVTTATVIKSGDMNLQLVAYTGNPYLVVGCNYGDKDYRSGSSVNAINLSCEADITEIWLE